MVSCSTLSPTRHPARRPRRFALLASLVAVFALVAAVLPAPEPAVAAAAPFADARAHWLHHLTGGDDFDPAAAPYAATVERITATAESHRQTIVANPTTDLWTDLDSATVTSDRHETFVRVREMALAYSTHGSALEGDQVLLTTITRALDWLSANRYNTSSVNDGNTWYWALGIPMELNDTITMLFDELAPARVNAFMAAEKRFLPGVYTTGPYSTGANRAWSAKVIALRGILTSSATLTTQAMNGIVPVMEHVTTGDGYYERGGFIQHTSIPYVGGYGASAIQLVAEVMHMLDDSPWAVVHPATANIYAAVRATYAPFIWRGAMMDSVRGREISREYNQDRDAGARTIQAIDLLAGSAASPATQQQLRSIVKRMLQDADLGAYDAVSSIDEIESARALLGDESLAAAAAPLGAVTFASMDRYVHRSAGYAFGVSASSARITNFETASNGENQKAWYTADGMTYLYTADTTQYTGNYWATVNRYRLPGTTVDTRKKGVNDGRNYRSKQTFSGGVASAAGSYGAYGMILDAVQSNLVAQKAWFTFDDEVVALGSGINDPAISGTGWDGRPLHVESIVENRRVEASDQSLVVDGTAVTSSTAAAFANPAWAQLSGSRGQVGYVFPGAEPLRAAKTTSTGSWFDVNAKNGTRIPRTDTYFSLWVDHGTATANATYSYVLLPGSTTTQTRAYATSPETTVLANTTAVAAVKETTKNAVGRSSGRMPRPP